MYRNQKKNTELKSCQALSWFCDTSHFVFCGQQSLWESLLLVSVELFLTIVWRKPWKPEARTPESIRKIGSREETFFKQNFMAFKAVTMIFAGLRIRLFLKSLCLAVLKRICWDMLKHILGINHKGIRSCNNHWAILFGLSWSPVRTSPYKKQL